MSRKYFGTDGIRGRANSGAMTPGVAMRAGMAAGRIFTRGDHRHRVVIGKDTRLSGYMIESALVAGFTSVGMDVFQFGPLPTPAVAMLTRSLRADMGVMITASHNQYQDNGIKFFGPDGRKLSDEHEAAIETLMDNGLESGLATSPKLGRAKRVDDSQARYIEFAKRTFPSDRTLEGLRIVIDCANGAAYKVAPEVLWELGAEIIPMGVAPDGFNINSGCGSTSTEAMTAKVREMRANFGIALDGDADRVVMADEHGRIIDGDQVLALLAKSWSAKGRLKGKGVVGTVMSNAGLERYLKTLNLKLGRAQVGDRYVIEQMQKGGFNIGGEQSGHIVLSGLRADRRRPDIGAAGAGGDRAGGQTCERGGASVRAGPAGAEERALSRRPRRSRTPASPTRIKDGEARLNGSGRVLVRKSGTEPVIRVMAEGDDEKLVRAVVNDIVTAIQEVAA